MTKEKEAGEGGFDPLALIENSIQQGFDSSLVQEIDERQLNWCPNVASWVLDSDYLGIGTIYPHQLQVMLRLFGDVCPYCSDWKFYQEDFEPDTPLDEVRDRLQLLEFGKCPKCEKTRLDHRDDGYFSYPDELNLCWGMRAGKSLVSGAVGSYVLHRFLKLPDPAQYFGLVRGSPLVMRFVALTAKQANESVWAQFVNSIQICTWFKQYHDFLKYYEKKHGVELGKWLNESFTYTHKSLSGYFQGASLDTSRGRTAAFTAMDEIGWWTGGDTAKRANAAETYVAFEKSARTVRNAASRKFNQGFYDCPTSWMTAVSSTSSKTDYIMRLIRQSKKDPKKIASHKASWEVNPEFKVNPTELDVERQKNPKAFDRDYGSIPPYATDPFFEEDQVFKTAKLDKPNWAIREVDGENGLYLDASNLEKDNSGIPYVLALDLGKSFCGYAAALLKLKEDDYSVVQIAGLFSVYPSQNKAIDLHSMFENFIKVVCEKLNIGLVLFDQWQSSTQIDALKHMKIKSESYSMVYQDFEHFRSQVLQGKLESVKPEISFADVEKSNDDILDVIYPKPYIHFLWQMLSICEVGRKLTKGDGHDDLFRAVSLGAAHLWDDEYRRDFEYRSGFLMQRRSSGGRLAMAGASRGGGGHYGTSNSTNANTATSQTTKRTLGAIISRGR